MAHALLLILLYLFSFIYLCSVHVVMYVCIDYCSVMCVVISIRIIIYALLCIVYYLLISIYVSY